MHPRVGGGVTFGAANNSITFSFDADSARRLADMIHEVNGSTPKVDRLNMVLLMCAVCSISLCFGIIITNVYKLS